MELAYYSDLAVRLVNSEEPARGTDALTSVDAVRTLFGESQQATRRATDADVTRLRSVRARLRAVFEAAADGDEVLAVDLLNALLIEFPVSPQISGHELRDEDGRPNWHMHIADYAANASAGFAATASMGLAFHLTELGADRLGICEAPPCRNAYLDTSTNRSRRYCSDRCATRANVAAYRARKRLDAGRSADSAPAADPAPAARATPLARDRDRTGRTADTAHDSSPVIDR
ncbi:CGNR zinc finger domain-containing protein [Streptomyces sp. Rer75]|uniref:CGNR zinc finger domain-containing protein n=1 Tax=Streptomyces sp. Rer75 TaxID=2750011 RepID=UPI00211EFCAA|nr:CGNR zinc finger domain-containing protein [Streptomyces sp. Rer75]